MLIVLPALLMRCAYWIWGLFTGKKAPVAPQPVQDAAGEKEVKKGVCPYHVFMNFFGFKIPEKKPVATAEEAQAPVADNQLKTE